MRLLALLACQELYVEIFCDESHDKYCVAYKQRPELWRWTIKHLEKNQTKYIFSISKHLLFAEIHIVMSFFNQDTKQSSGTCQTA